MINKEKYLYLLFLTFLYKNCIGLKIYNVIFIIPNLFISENYIKHKLI